MVSVVPLTTVALQASSQAVRVEISLSNPRPRAGEEVQLYLDVLARRQVITLDEVAFAHVPLRLPQLEMPAFADVDGLELVRPLERLAAARAVDAGSSGFHVAGVPGEVFLDREPLTTPDPQWYRYRFRVPVRLRHPGEITVPAARLTGQLYIAPGWSDFKVVSEPLKATVREAIAASSGAQ